MVLMGAMSLKMRSQRETESLATQRGVTAFTLPIRYHEFATKLGSVLS